MRLRPGKLTLLLLIPLVLYGVAKGLLYHNAKSTVDDIVDAVARQATVTYSDISTDLRGAVAVSGISVQPLGSQDTVAIDRIRVSSDDPMFFLRSAQWQPGESAPPPSLDFAVSGIRVPLFADFMRELQQTDTPAPDAAQSACADGLQIDTALLQRLGFDELQVDVDGFYRLDEERRELAVGMDFDLHDIETMRVEATMTDVDVQMLSAGAAPGLNLGGFKVAFDVSPAFGRQALKHCAIGTEQNVQQWSEQLAAKALESFSDQGVELGPGLSAAVRAFYRDWGEFEVVAAPAKPVGLLSLMFVPPDRLAQSLGLRMALNGSPITDTSFTWVQDSPGGLAALFGQQPPTEAAKPKARKRPARIIVQRQFEAKPVTSIARHVDRQVRISVPGAPLREGLLKRIRDGEAELEQSVSGGKFTAHVPIDRIDGLQVLVERRVSEP